MGGSDYLTARGGGVASQIVTKRTTANIGTPERLPLTDLNLHHKNPRQGDVDAIMGSMVANGVYNPLTVNRGTHTGRPNEVLAGNHRLKAMRRLAEQNPDDPRWQTVDVWMVDVDEDRATKILLSDNRTSDLGDYDNTALLALLDMVEDDLDGTGYGEGDIAELLELANDTPLDTLEDDDTNGAEDTGEGTATRTLAERFGVPPFTVINTTKGAWQARKKAWKALKIASHEGREEGLTFAIRSGLYRNWYEVKNKALQDNPDLTSAEIEEQYQDQLTPYAQVNNTSVFDPVLAELLYTWFSTTNDKILDPWAGGSVRGIIAAATGRHYTGHELREEQVTANRDQWEQFTQIAPMPTTTPPTWIIGDSRKTMRDHTPNTFDFIIGCPPYYDLEEYSDDPNDLSTMATEEFDQAMADTLATADQALQDNRFAAFIIAPVRDKHGTLRDMKKCMIDAAPDGWHLVNDMVLINATGTARLRAARSMQGTRTLTRTHQDIVIFAKGDRKKAAKRLGEVQMLDLEDTQTA